MGPLGSELSKIGLQITDSAYVVVSMKIMSRMGQGALDALGDNSFVACMHSVGVPLDDADSSSQMMSSSPKTKRVSWPCDLKRRNICHFPETNEIWSFGRLADVLDSSLHYISFFWIDLCEYTSDLSESTLLVSLFLSQRIWREFVAWKEVLCSSHCINHGTTRRMASRAHAGLF
jgi:hypothetical protein